VLWGGTTYGLTRYTSEFGRVKPAPPEALGYNFPMQQWLFLSIAIVSEVMATSALKASAGFTRPLPSLVVVVGYGVAFYFLSLTLKTVPVGVAYAIWSGAGVALIALVGWAFLGQRLDAPAILGLALIVAGVVVINVFSKSVSH